MKFIVRDLISSDLPKIYKFLTDREIAYLNNTNPNESYADFESKYNLYLNGRAEDLRIFTIALDDVVIGKMEIGYDLEDRAALFDVLIGNKQLWGKGYGTKALNVLLSYGFNNLGLNRISCEVYSFNERMISLMSKMKMHIDGILREAQFVHDKYVDIFVYSILKKEYEGDV